MELGEAHPLRVLEHRNHQGSRPVLPGHVHRESQVDAVGDDPVGSPLDDRQAVAHHAVPSDSLHHGVADEMGERDPLAPAGHLERRVELGATALQRPHR